MKTTRKNIVKQLTIERDKVARQLAGLNAAIHAFVGSYTGASKTTVKKRTLSPEARARIAAAQRARWAKVKAKKKKGATK